MSDEAEGAEAVEGEADPVDFNDDDELETAEEDDGTLPDDLDPDDEPEKFAGPEGRDEQDIPEGVD